MSKRLTVVSHPCVVPVNQAVYDPLVDSGWEVDIVVPSRWRHEYQPELFAPAPLAGARFALHAKRVALPGLPQRHFYVANVGRVLEELRPSVVFLEQEPFSISGFQWGVACHRRGIPFGYQADENLDRPYPLVARAIRRWALRHADFIAARSPTAANVVRQHGARCPVELVPHAVPPWEPVPRNDTSGVFSVGYAGRLIPEKGIEDLVAAVARLDRPVRLVVAGDGPLRGLVEDLDGGGVNVVRLTGISHEEMNRAYAEMDVLVLASRTTESWVEQFGRVLVEALWCGVPVIGSSSGEIPWVIGSTGGGEVFPEGDVDGLAATIEGLRADRPRRAELSMRGRDAVDELFSVDGASARLGQLLNRAVDGATR